jgi:hypothetical protein
VAAVAVAEVAALVAEGPQELQQEPGYCPLYSLFCSPP